MIASYNASVVNFYSATGSLACFNNKNIFFYFEKRSSLLQRWLCSCKLTSRRIGSKFRQLVCLRALNRVPSVIYTMNKVNRDDHKLISLFKYHICIDD
jgi:hypothetical protein